MSQQEVADKEWWWCDSGVQTQELFSQSSSALWWYSWSGGNTCCLPASGYLAISVPTRISDVVSKSKSLIFHSVLKGSFLIPRIIFFCVPKYWAKHLFEFKPEVCLCKFTTSTLCLAKISKNSRKQLHKYKKAENYRFRHPYPLVFDRKKQKKNCCRRLWWTTAFIVLKVTRAEPAERKQTFTYYYYGCFKDELIKG